MARTAPHPGLRHARVRTTLGSPHVTAPGPAPHPSPHLATPKPAPDLTPMLEPGAPTTFGAGAGAAPHRTAPTPEPRTRNPHPGPQGPPRPHRPLAHSAR
ncbi:hypothetical protein FHS42_006593 [Streptomyces zagrosensis]|uniref:Uncharacterized protein n=1 Tax=Streptomyces zagrosensis TaxID=1042984 RepID=A0A7W9QGD4_9ACTN|nr:hypothetical protein [Streptomyces zagrosensis]